MLEDARHVVAGPFTTTGHWTAAEIFDHLARAFDGSLDGYGFVAPLWLRLLVRPFRNGILVKPMKSGIRLPARAATLLPAKDASTEEALAHLERSAQRLKSEKPEHFHPIMGRLTPEEYLLLHLRHAELHLGFIVPTA